VFRTPWLRQAFEEEMLRSWARVEVLHDTSPAPGGLRRLLAGRRRAHILNIAPTLRRERQGHGARLLRHILERGRRASYRTVELEVRRSEPGGAGAVPWLKFQQVGNPRSLL